MGESNNIQRLHRDGKEIILVGTAHVSPSSVAEVKAVIEEEQPDSVCVELDPGRYKALEEKDQWKNADIVKIIKSGKAGFLFANIILSNYQRKLADQFGIQSGQEMLQAIASAKDCHAKLVLADRDIQTTFIRIWRGCSLWEKCKLMVTIMMSIIDNEEITEEDLETLKGEDMLTAALSELGDSFHGVKTYLVDERDAYLADQIDHAPGSKIIAVVGAAHLPGICEKMGTDVNINSLSETPPKSAAGKIIGWSIPLLLVALVILTFTVNPDSGWSQTVNWLVLTMGGAGLGALISLPHPLTVLTAIVVAPISALSPVLAAGWFSGLMEAHLRKPKVEDFEHLATDLTSPKGFWKNKVTKILLVVITTNLGCALGNIIGSLHVIQVFFGTFLN